MKTNFIKSFEKITQTRTAAIVEDSRTISASYTLWKKTCRSKIDDLYSWTLQKGAQISCLIK